MQINQAKQSTPWAFNAFFAILMAGMSIYFLIWGFDYTYGNQKMLFLVATFFGIFMAFNIGGNDVANSFGTSVGAGTLTVTQALIVAAIFEVSGAVLAGAAVTDTIKSGIVNMSAIHDAAIASSLSEQEFVNQYIYLMLSALIAAAFWLLFATKKGFPVSTTHAIIGGIVGSSIVFGIQIGGADFATGTVKWGKIGEIAVSWVVSPLLGAALSFVIYGLIKKNILAYNDKMEEQVKVLRSEKKQLKRSQKEYFEKLSDAEKISYTTALMRDQEIYKDLDIKENLTNKNGQTIADSENEAVEFETDYYKALYDLEHRRENLDTLKALKHWVPLIAAAGAIIMTAMLVFKGLKNINLNMSTLQASLVMGMIGAMVWLTAFIYTKTIRGKHKEDLAKATFVMFSWMQVFTACAFAFSHGSNDIANAVGPFVAIMDAIRESAVAAKASVPGPVLTTFGVALVVGLWFMGKEVIQTVGSNLAEMHPASGFSAELAAAAVVMGASSLGIPVSSTHILVGAVLGIGIVNKDANWKLMKPIGLAWIITLPAATLISAISYLILSSVF